jgi:hypothetical protein
MVAGAGPVASAAAAARKLAELQADEIAKPAPVKDTELGNEPAPTRA